jgi:hypothetical protein
MNRIFRFLVVIALCAGLPATVAQAAASTDAQRPELAYLKQVNQWRPPSDPQLIFLLMAQFANAGRHAEGIAYFNGVLKRFDAELDATRTRPCTSRRWRRCERATRTMSFCSAGSAGCVTR